jgi:hypothetical protein
MTEGSSLHRFALLKCDEGNRISAITAMGKSARDRQALEASIAPYRARRIALAAQRAVAGGRVHRTDVPPQGRAITREVVALFALMLLAMTIAVTRFRRTLD